MSRYFNDEGEPLMTAAEARFEDALDEQSAHERADDDDRDYVDEDEQYPIGETLLCYTCKPVVGEPRLCTKLGAVVGRADPTQTYVLDCGHVTI